MKKISSLLMLATALPLFAFEMCGENLNIGDKIKSDKDHPIYTLNISSIEKKQDTTRCFVFIDPDQKIVRLKKIIKISTIASFPEQLENGLIFDNGDITHRNGDVTKLNNYTDFKLINLDDGEQVVKNFANYKSFDDETIGKIKSECKDISNCEVTFDIISANFYYGKNLAGKLFKNHIDKEYR